MCDGTRRIFLANDRFVDIRIEADARLRDRLQAVPLQDVEELFVDERDAFVKLVAFLGVLERAVEVVEDREEIADDAGRARSAEEVLLLALGAFAEVLEVGQRAHVAVAERRSLCAPRPPSGVP